MIKDQLKKTIFLKNAVLLPIAVLLMMSFCNMKTASNTDPQYALVANESFPTLSKFELDLYSGHEDWKKSTEGIWLSVRGTNIIDITNGTYSYSRKDASTRAASTFYGSRFINGKGVSIIAGSFTVAKDEAKLSVDYDFTLEDGTKITGKYAGQYQSADWRSKK